MLKDQDPALRGTSEHSPQTHVLDPESQTLQARDAADSNLELTKRFPGDADCAEASLARAFQTVKALGEPADPAKSQ